MAATDSSSALTDLITNQNITVCPDKCFRPVGLAFDGAGRLWMSSDSTGEIYVLQRTGESGPGKFVQPSASSGSGSGSGSSGTKNAAAGLWKRETMVLGWSVVVAVGGWLVVF